MRRKNTPRHLTTNIAKAMFLLCALVAILSLATVAIYIFKEGMPLVLKVGFFDFVTGTKWAPLAGKFGIAPMIIASFFATLGAVIIGVPIGVYSAVFIAEYAPKRVEEIIKPMIQLLAAIPSVIYGFFGLVVLVPLISTLFGGAGNSLFAVVIVLSMMILPTIITVAETSIRAVPEQYREASLAIGASHSETIFQIIIPAAKSGIFAGVVLGIGRAMGETMAVMLVAGNTVRMPEVMENNWFLNYMFSSVRTLTANTALEMGYAQGDHEKALIATGMILFMFIMILNLVLTYVKNKAGAYKS